MAEEEIRMRVSIEDAASAPLDRVSQAEGKLATQQEELSRVTQTRAGASSSLRDRLVELIREEQIHKDEVAKGRVETQDAAAESARRRNSIENLVSILKGQEQAERAATKMLREAGDAAAETGDKAGLAGKLLGGFGDAAGSMVAKFTAFTAIAGAVVTALNQIATAARESFNAVADLGKAVGELAGNVGGKTADKMKGKADDFAKNEGTGIAGRNQALQSLADITDKRDMNEKEMEQYLELSTKLHSATGVGGKEQARMMHSVMARLNKSAPEAAGMLTTLLAKGAEAGSLAPLLDRVGAGGGEEMIGTIFAANKRGLDMNEATRGAMSIMDAMSREDEHGRLDQKLRRQGLTAQMTPVERFRTLAMQYSTGQLDEKKFINLLGGPAVAHVALPLAQAVGTQDEINARADLADPDAMQKEILKQDESGFKQADKFKKRNELYAKKAAEESGLAGTGAAIDYAESRVPGWVPGRGAIGKAGGMFAGMVGANVQKIDETSRAIERGERRAAEQPQAPFRVDEGYAPDGRDVFTGAAAAALAPGGLPTEVYPVSPLFVEPIVDRGGGELMGWRMRRPGQAVTESVVLTLNEVHTVIDPNFEDPAHEYEGMSPLKAAYAAVNQFFKADQANINSLDRGVEPGGVFVAPDALSEPQVKYLRDELADRHGGIGNRGRPMVLHGGMDWKPIARAYAEMEFSLLRTMSRTDICAVFNVPPAVIGY